MNIEIDQYSGFCFGVIKAIEKAENYLKTHSKLYCLGELVHNDLEMERLSQKGLITINYDELKKLKNTTVLIRAHGEPPETYEIIKKNNITIIDATCPVVLKLQKKIKDTYSNNKDRQIVIFGKKGHAEVNGLVGQTENNAIVITDKNDLSKIDFNKPISLFSQTTQSPQKYNEIIKEIKKRLNTFSTIENFEYYNSICRQVLLRNNKLKLFAQKHDLIIFVSGKNSSNGKVLFEICKSVNKNSYFISTKDEINFLWFNNVNSVGICGATSTPRWLMEEVAKYIQEKIKT